MRVRWCCVWSCRARSGGVAVVVDGGQSPGLFLDRVLGGALALQLGEVAQLGHVERIGLLGGHGATSLVMAASTSSNGTVGTSPGCIPRPGGTGRRMSRLSAAPVQFPTRTALRR